MVEFRHFELRSQSGEVVARLPAGRHETLYQALERVGRPAIRTRCRGSSLCGQCWVRVEAASGLEPARPDEEALLLREAPHEPRARLACRLRIPDGETSVAVSTSYWP